MKPTNPEALEASLEPPRKYHHPRTSLDVSRRFSYVLWIMMAVATISVTFYSEIPLLHQPQERAVLHDLRWILIPHALAGTAALLLGPFQFSTKLRGRNPAIHRIVGRFT